jgi:DNA polymerase-1
MKNMNEFHANKNKVMLVDGDLLAYKITSSQEEPINWGNDDWTLHCDFNLCKQLWVQSIAYYLSLTKSKDALICFSDKNNFRKELDSTYKSYRKNIRKPVCYNELKEWVATKFKTQSFKNLEGDDVLGILATGDYKDKCVIVSGDKDMRTISSWHCFIIDDSIEYVDANKADYNFCTQVLVGDQADGYKGCAGVGAVKASRVLLDKKNIDELWEAVVAEFLRNKYVPDDAYHQARMARILRAGEYNYKTNKPKLWNYRYEDFTNTANSRKAS